MSQTALVGAGPSGVAGSSYTRTAFVSSGGNDGTAALNNASLPYLTQDAAVAALAAAYPGQTTTLRYLSDITGDISVGVDIQTLLEGGLTMRSHDATKRTITGTVSILAASIALTLTNIGIANATALCQGITPTALGTITGDATTTIGTLNLSGDTAGSDAADGDAGSDDTGGNGAHGSSGDPPTNGDPGGDADASGSGGGAGGNGNAAFNLILAGSGTITQLNAFGKNGGAGGSGGDGAIAVAGHGGSGGSSTAPVDPQDGGSGANGGNANADGGDGGPGGNGGDGGTITKAAGWTITASNLAGGTGGAGGAGGTAGTATGGSGGSGGSGANGGNPGNNGATGASNQNDGATGSAGANGANGAIV